MSHSELYDIFKDSYLYEKCYRKIKTMHLSSNGLVSGVFLPKFGAASDIKLGPMPLISPPFKWSCFPPTTESFAITIVDYDTIPLLGFPWIHWVACNIPAHIRCLPENASQIHSNIMCQGVNSYADGYTVNLKEIESFKVPRKSAACYGGFSPLGNPHLYTVTIYALNTTIDIKEGYTFNELYNKMINHIVGTGYLHGIYDAKVAPL
ncbi:MAG: YbhB/YbcL family Raf kinase inhibitor-like protein [Clostridium sp.]